MSQPVKLFDYVILIFYSWFQADYSLDHEGLCWMRKAITQLFVQLLPYFVYTQFFNFLRNFHRFFIEIASETQKGHLYVLGIYKVFGDL